MFPLNPKLDWGLANTDIRNLGVVSGTYQLPFGSGMRFFADANSWRGVLASGWSMSAIGTVQSGFPFTPQLGFNPTNNGDTRNPIRPSWNPDFSGSIISGSATQYYNPNAFILPPAGTYGNVPRKLSHRPRNVGAGFVLPESLAPVGARSNCSFAARYSTF